MSIGIRLLMKRTFFLLIGVLVSAVCLAKSLQGVSPHELTQAFSHADYRTLPLILGLLFGFYWLKTMRWSWLLRPVEKLSTRQLFGPMLIGFAANNLLPAHLGEFIRVYFVRRQYGVPVGAVLSTVVLERIFDVMAILALFGIGLAYSDELPANYQKGAIFLGGGALALVAAVVVYLIWTEWFVRVASTILAKFSLIPPWLTKKILDLLRTGADGLGALRSVRSVTAIIISSMIQWLMNGMMAYVALRAFGIPVSLATGLIVTGVTAFAVTIPSTPGYFGVIQVAFRLSMEAQANPPDPALVLGSSVYYHLSMYIPVTLLGIYYLQQSGLQLKDLQSDKLQVSDDSPNESTGSHSGMQS